MRFGDELSRALRSASRVASDVLSVFVAPWFICAASLLIGVGLMVAGVFVLAGFGWALIAASAPCLAFGYITLRGLARG